MSGHLIAALISTVLCFGMLWIIFIYAPRTKTRTVYLMFLFTLTFWVITSCVTWGIDNKKLAIIFTRLSYLIVPFFPAFYVHLIYTMVNTKIKKYLLPASYVFAAIFLFLGQTKYFITDLTPYNGLYYVPVLGPTYIAFAVYLYVCVTAACFDMLFVAIRATGQEKVRLLYFVFGTLFGFLGYSTFVLMMLRLKTFWADIPHDIFVSGYVIILTYAIVRHHLMEIDVIVKKTLVFAGLFGASYAVIASFAFIGQTFFENIMGLNRWLSFLPSVTVIVLILRPLENFLLRTTDKYLFQKKFDYRELLRMFSTEVLSLMDTNKLAQTTVERLSDIMKIDSCGILFLNKVNNNYELIASTGIDKSYMGLTLSMDNTLTTFLNRTKAYLSIKDTTNDSPIPKHIMEHMNKLRLQLAIPLVTYDEMHGILTLGKKKSDEDYTPEDIDIILTLSRTLAIAISNSRVLDELGKTQAEAAQREKMAVIGTLSAGINHEICNPLGIARGQCEAFLLNLRDGLYKSKTDKELVDKAVIIMNKVIHETDRATAITKRLSSFAKPSKGLYSEDVNVRDSITEVLALVGYEMRLDKVEITNLIPADLPHIKADKKQIEEVFFNLIRNSAQAIADTGKITISARQLSYKVQVNVEDTGHGIPDDKIDQIFNPFYTTKDPGQGTGLGLFIVRQVVERNSGKISVRSRVGIGTTFTLEFPIPTTVDA